MASVIPYQLGIPPSLSARRWRRSWLSCFDGNSVSSTEAPQDLGFYSPVSLSQVESRDSILAQWSGFYPTKLLLFSASAEPHLSWKSNLNKFANVSQLHNAYISFTSMPCSSLFRFLILHLASQVRMVWSHGGCCDFSRFENWARSDASSLLLTDGPCLNHFEPLSD